MRFYKIYIFISFAIWSNLMLKAQEPLTSNDSISFEDPFIRWVNQYPPVNRNEKEKFKDHFINYLFGKDNQATLIKPVAVLATNTEDYWALDQESGTVLRIHDQLGEIPHFRNKSINNLRSLVGICSLPQGKLLLTDSYLNKIFQYDPDQKELKILNDSLVLERPTGIAYSPVNQEIWVVETGAHRVSVLSSDGYLLRRIGSRGVGPGEFNYPTSIWIDKFGKVFIVDALNFRIQVFSVNGDILSVFGKTGDGTGCLARPKGIATDSESNIYVADALYNVVQIFDMDGHFLYKFGSQGRDPGQFWMPAGIYIDENDFIYVADTYNARVQVFQLTRNKGK